MKVLITGGTGTFGHACTRALLTRGDQVICFSRDELKQSEMRRLFPEVTFWIGDVRDRDSVLEACSQSVDLVIHAAALKQVGTGQRFPREVFKTNVLGVENVLAATRAAHIPTVVALSTDKAVQPINAYGKSKAAAEVLVRQSPVRAGQRRIVVRYGNVIGSRGSVVPLFLEQRTSGVLRVTSLEATRFWMPIEQAVDIVLWAAASASHASIVVPRIPSARVADVARAIGPGCRIEEIGLGDGEKLHEELIADDERACSVGPDGASADRYLITDQPIGAVAFGYGESYRSDVSPQPVTFRELAPCV